MCRFWVATGLAAVLLVVLGVFAAPVGAEELVTGSSPPADEAAPFLGGEAVTPASLPAPGTSNGGNAGSSPDATAGEPLAGEAPAVEVSSLQTTPAAEAAEEQPSSAGTLPVVDAESKPPVSDPVVDAESELAVSDPVVDAESELAVSDPVVDAGSELAVSDPPAGDSVAETPAAETPIAETPVADAPAEVPSAEASPEGVLPAEEPSPELAAVVVGPSVDEGGADQAETVPPSFIPVDGAVGGLDVESVAVAPAASPVAPAVVQVEASSAEGAIVSLPQPAVPVGLTVATDGAGLGPSSGWCACGGFGAEPSLGLTEVEPVGSVTLGGSAAAPATPWPSSGEVARGMVTMAAFSPADPVSRPALPDAAGAPAIATGATAAGASSSGSSGGSSDAAFGALLFGAVTVLLGRRLRLQIEIARGVLLDAKLKRPG
jgi:hypothetical protein